MGGCCTNGPSDGALNKVKTSDVLKTPTWSKLSPLLFAVAGHIEQRSVTRPSMIHISTSLPS